MKYLLDTNTCIRYLNGRSPNIKVRLAACVDADIAVCSIVKAELSRPLRFTGRCGPACQKPAT